MSERAIPPPVESLKLDTVASPQLCSELSDAKCTGAKWLLRNMSMLRWVGSRNSIRRCFTAAALSLPEVVLSINLSSCPAVFCAVASYMRLRTSGPEARQKLSKTIVFVVVGRRLLWCVGFEQCTAFRIDTQLLPPRQVTFLECKLVCNRHDRCVGFLRIV